MTQRTETRKAPSAATRSKILKRQQIDQSGPGTILVDFETLLAFVGSDGLKASGKNYRLPMAALGDLDEQMTRPLRPNLKRPQQLSYPHLNGLFLLLRATGLGISSGKGASGRLSVDPDRLGEWRTLSAEEQYFTLFQATLQSDWGQIDSDDTSGNGPWYVLGWRTDSWLRQQPPTAIEGMRASDVIGGWREQAVAALLEMFGMLDLPRAAPLDGENWRITSFRVTEFGNAFLTRLREPSVLDQLLGVIDESRHGETGSLADLFRDCFPNCRNTLFSDNDQGEFVDGVWQFDVSLEDASRRIRIPADFSVEALADTILKAFDFDNDHLHEMRLRDRSGRNLAIGHPAIDDVEYHTDEFAIGSLPLDPGQSMLFLFDFGDGWEFTVALEELLPSDAGLTEPKIVKRKGKPPKQYPDPDFILTPDNESSDS